MISLRWELGLAWLMRCAPEWVEPTRLSMEHGILLMRLSARENMLIQ